MKKRFQSPYVQTLHFSMKDVIVTSLEDAKNTPEEETVEVQEDPEGDLEEIPQELVT